MNDAKKVLVTSDLLTIGGIQTSLIRLLDLLVEENYVVDLVLFNRRGELFKEINPKVNKIILSDKKSMYDKMYQVKLLRYWYRTKLFIKSIFFSKKYLKNKYCELKNKTYDFALAFHGYANEVDMIAASVESKKKFIWVHNDYVKKFDKGVGNKLKFATMKFKYKYFDKVICVSDRAATSFKTFKLIENHKINVLKNYLPTLKIKKQAKEVEDKVIHIIDNQKLNFVAIARLESVKGLDRLVSAFATYLKSYSDSMLYIIGDGPELENLKLQIKKYNVSKNVFLMGSMSNPYGFLKLADVFVMSSRYEGFGMTVLEAMAVNTRVISTDIGTIRELECYKESGDEIVIYPNSKIGILNGLNECGKTGKKEVQCQHVVDKYNEKVIITLKNMFN